MLGNFETVIFRNGKLFEMYRFLEIKMIVYKMILTVWYLFTARKFIAYSLGTFLFKI